jgi:hypothetical protein
MTTVPRAQPHPETILWVQAGALDKLRTMLFETRKEEFLQQPYSQLMPITAGAANIVCQGIESALSQAGVESVPHLKAWQEALQIQDDARFRAILLDARSAPHEHLEADGKVVRAELRPGLLHFKRVASITVRDIVFYHAGRAIELAEILAADRNYLFGHGLIEASEELDLETGATIPVFKFNIPLMSADRTAGEFKDLRLA